MNQNFNRREDWHALSPDKVLEEFQSSFDGLSEEEAIKRQKEHGENKLEKTEKQSALIKFFSQFNNVLIYILIAAAGVTAILGYWLDTAVILAVVVVNASIGFFQETKAEKALEAISKMLSSEAEVKRDKKPKTINAKDVVPGDVILLKSGVRVPADLRILKARELSIDEAILTGESEPAGKSSKEVGSEKGLGDRSSMAYSGTFVTSGHGEGVVVGISDNTEIGKIKEMVLGEEEITTPLIAQVTSFGRILALAIVLVSGLLFGFGVFVSDISASEMLLVSAALAVAAIPEGLPAIMTVTLAIGVQRMANRNAIIRKLTAVDTLGALTVICTDKTGTLTRNEMTVRDIYTIDHHFRSTGTGYKPEGEFKILTNKSLSADEGAEQGSSDLDDGSTEILKGVLTAGLLCNESRLVRKDENWTAQGNPTEVALITAAVKFGLNKDQMHEWMQIDSIPFESKTRYMATAYKTEEKGVVFVKGAPEKILEMSSCDNQTKKQWENWAGKLAEQGQRVLAIAQADFDRSKNELKPEDTQKNLRMLGLFGIMDPPREEAVEAIAICKKAGIRVKMVTGDHAKTALAIGKQLGIGDGEKVLRGVELENLDDQELKVKAAEVDVFARVGPANKLRLVEALQAEHEVIGMTGDGANDAPALKRADVGIAMGQKGTELSKEASDMVLADDNFASIANAVAEGRTVYDNLRKTILFLLPTNGGQSLTIILAVILGSTLPLTPVQILWVNMVTAVTLALSLAFEPAEEDVMERAPRNPQTALVTLFLLWRIVFVSLVLSLGTFAVFWFHYENGMELEHARTLAVNMLVMFQIFYLFNTRYLLNPVRKPKDFVGNRYVLLAIGVAICLQLLFTYLPFLQNLFGTTGLSLSNWLLIVPLGLSVFLLVEIEKFIVRKRSDDNVGKI